MLESDLQAVLEIERACFADPWPKRWFKQAVIGRDICWGAFDLENDLVGYLIAVQEDHLMHLANLAIAENYRRKGIARKLVGQLLETSNAEGFERIYLEVRRSNQPAIELYESFGFAQVRIEKAYYFGSEDALVLEWNSKDSGPDAA